LPRCRFRPNAPEPGNAARHFRQRDFANEVLSAIRWIGPRNDCVQISNYLPARKQSLDLLRVLKSQRLQEKPCGFQFRYHAYIAAACLAKAGFAPLPSTFTRVATNAPSSFSSSADKPAKSLKSAAGRELAPRLQFPQLPIAALFPDYWKATESSSRPASSASAPENHSRAHPPQTPVSHLPRRCPCLGLATHRRAVCSLGRFRGPLAADRAKCRLLLCRFL